MMKRINKQFFRFSLILLLFGTGSFVSAQNNHFCGTMEAMKELYKSDELMLKDYQKLLESNKQIIKNKNGRSEEVYTIPVVFHVLHEYGSEKISDAQIFNQIQILNDDFRGLNDDGDDIIPEFKNLFADSRIEFKLAAYDYAGNCTNGIDHIYTHETNNGDDFSKLNQWPRDRYLNIWVVKTINRPGVAGYAYYPSATNGAFFRIDGIVVGNNYVGSIGTGSPNGSRTLTHEIGHYLGLSHTWGSTNEPGVSCGDDGVEDTPLTAGHSSCQLYSTTCVIVDTTFNSTFDVVNGSTFNPNIIYPDHNFGNFTANGVSNTPAETDKFVFSDWALGGLASDNDTSYLNLTGSLDNSKYIEVSVNIEPTLGYQMRIKSIAFNVIRNFGGSRSFAVRSSIDNYASNMLVTKSLDPTNKIRLLSNREIFFVADTIGTFPRIFVTIPGQTNSRDSKTITFRIYSWNAEDSNGSFGIDDFSVNTYRTVIENVQNYMEYAFCSAMYTPGQAEVMRASLNNTNGQRNNLLTAYVKEKTGIDLETPPLCTPLPDFHSTQRFNCAGTTVQFSNMSTRAIVDEFLWEFPGGTPSTSTEANPVVTYTDNARYSVTLTVTNAAGSETITKNDYVVSSAFTDYFGPAMETFNAGLGNHWYLDNPTDNESYFQLVNSNGYDNSKCLKLNNILTTQTNAFYNFNLGQSKDAIITPNFDLSNTSSASFSFKYSYATTSTTAASLTEQINIYTSTDCGKTWTKRRDIKSNVLTNVGFKLEAHTPSSNAEWATYTTQLLPSWNLNRKNVKFKIEFVASDFSNNLYIDDINIDGVLSSRGLENELAEISVYPNPTSNDINLNLNFIEERNASIELVDLNGKVLMNLESGKFIGEKIIAIPMKNLTNGIYFVRVTGSDFFKIEKVIKQ